MGPIWEQMRWTLWIRCKFFALVVKRFQFVLHTKKLLSRSVTLWGFQVPLFLFSPWKKLANLFDTVSERERNIFAKSLFLLAIVLRAFGAGVKTTGDRDQKCFREFSQSDPTWVVFPLYTWYEMYSRDFPYLQQVIFYWNVLPNTGKMNLSRL